MNKELIDRAWACLPREFKEKVNKKYAICAEIDADDNPHLPAYAVKSAISRKALLEELFGHHNLTSDAVGEEILTVPRSAVIAEMDKLHKYSYQIPDLQLGLNALTALFGSKCLPDELNEDNFASIEPKSAEQSMTDSETEHTKDKFATQMQGKFTEQDFTEAKQRTESCMASIPQFELPKQIEAQIDEAMGSIKAESRKQFGDFGAANADIAILVYRQMMRFGALLALSAGDLESERTDSDRGDYISTTKPTDPNK